MAVESVWDYPRPPTVRQVSDLVTITLAGVMVARSEGAVQVLETSHPPTVYLPREAFLPGSLVPSPGGTTWCEFKGAAHYLDVVAGDVRAERAAWTYPAPSPGFEQLAGLVAVYPGRMERCTLDGEVVAAQPGDFYGGWITSKVSGPFKGAVGTRWW